MAAVRERIVNFAKTYPDVFSGVWFAIQGFLAFWWILFGLGAIKIPLTLAVPASLLSTAIAFGCGSIIAKRIIMDPAITFFRSTCLGMLVAIVALLIFIVCVFIFELRSYISVKLLFEVFRYPLEILSSIVILLTIPISFFPAVIIGGSAGGCLHKVVKS